MPINLNYLKELADGDKDFMVDMVQTFIDNAPSYLHEFNAFKSELDVENLGKVAHKSKATFLFMGLDHLSNTSASLEKLCKGNANTTEILQLLNQLEPDFLQVLAELNAALEDLKKS